MAVDTKDTSDESKDVVKSSLAAAYEDGVSSLGDKPPATIENHLMYAFKSPEIPPAGAPGTTSARSSTINTKRIQSIASMNLSPEEIIRCKDLIAARKFEDGLDYAILKRVWELNDEQGWHSKLDKIKEGFPEEIASSQEAMKAVAAIVFFLNHIERVMSKGTWIQQAEYTDNEAGIFDLSSHANVRIVENFDTLSYDKMRFQYGSAAGDMPNISILRDIAAATGISESTLNVKTMSATLAQCWYDTQVCLEFGVSPKFMEKILGSRESSTDVLYGADHPGLNPTCRAMVVGVNKYTSYDITQSTKFTPIYKMIQAGKDWDDHSASIGGHSDPSKTSYMFPQGSVSTYSVNPLNHIIPKITETMEHEDALFYLANIVATEMQTSVGMTADTTLSTAYGASPAINTLSPDPSTQMTLSGIQSSGRPWLKAHQDPITEVMFATRHMRDGSYPGLSYSPAWTHGLGRTVIYEDDVREGFGSEKMAPFEMLDPAIDGETEYESVDPHVDTLKTRIMDKLRENPEEIAPDGEIHDLISDSVARIDRQNMGTGEYFTKIRSNSGIAGARQLIALCHSDIADLIDEAQSGALTANTTLYSLIGLSKFIKSNRSGNNKNQVLKTMFFRRMCLYDATQTQHIREHYVLGNAKDPQSLYYSDAFMTWAASKLWSGPIETVGSDTESYLGYHDPNVDSSFEASQFMSILMSMCNDQNVKDAIAMGLPPSSGAVVEPSDIMQQTRPTGVDPKDWDSLYPGEKIVTTGDGFMRFMIGQMAGGYTFAKKLHERVQAICHTASFQFGHSNTSVFPEGTTRASGMDRGQLMALVFEIYLLIVESTLSGDVVLAPATVTAMLEHSTGAEQNIQAGLGNTSDEIVTSFINNQVYLRLVPSLVQDTTKLTGYDVNTPVTCNLQDMAALFRAIKTVTQKNAESIWQEDDDQFLIDLDNFFGITPTLMEMLQENGGTYAIDPKSGESLSTSNVRRMLMTCAEEQSAPAEAFSPAAVLLSYWTTTLAISFVIADLFSGQEQDEELMNAVKKVPDRFKDFLSNTSVRQLGSATYRLKLLEEAESNYGFAHTDFNADLDDAALLYLETFDDSSSQDIIFIGIPTSLMRNHLLKYTNEFSDKTFNSAESLKYQISADRSSEFNEFVTFTPDFEGVTYDSKYSINREMIATALKNPAGPTFEDLVSAAEFYVAGPDLLTASTKTGTEIFEESGAAELVLARTVLESEILKYIFERTTRLTVSEWCLSDSNVNIQGLDDHVDWLGTIQTNNAPSLSEPGGGFDGVRVRSKLYKTDTDLLNRLGEDGLVTFTKNAGVPRTFETSKEKLSKVLEPQLKRVGQEAYFEDPLISQKSLILGEILSHSHHARRNSIASSVFTPGIFDLVIGIRLEGIDEDWIADTGSIPEDSWKDAAEASSVGLASTIDSTVNGLVRVDNYRLTVSTGLSEG